MIKKLLVKKLVKLVLTVFLIVLFFRIFYYSPLVEKSYATDVIGNISTNTTWNLAGSPYNLTGNVTVISGAILTIDAGVQIRSNGNYYLRVDTGTLDANGTLGSEVIFLHNTLTVAGSWAGIQVYPNGTATLDYARIYYATIGVRVNTGTLTVNDSLFNTNHVGISITERGNITTARNTFTKNTYFALDMNPDVGIVNLGSGVDTDILGTVGGGDANGYDAIGIAYSDDISADCPSDICTLSQRTFAGISNIPYVTYRNYYMQGSNDTLVIDAGVILKMGWDDTLTVRLGAILDVNGTSGNEVIITSDRDDTHGGDTNNNGSANTPLASDWSSILLESGASTIDYAEITYGDRVRIVNTGSSLTVQDTLFDTNVDGVAVYNQAGLTTARNTFTNNTRVSVGIDPDVGTINFGSGGDVDIIGTVGGGDANGYDAIGIGVIDSDTGNCPSDTCTLSQRTFAGISNIPYVIVSNYYVQGSNDTLVIDAGVILKMYWNMNLLVRSGAILDVNGTSGNEVIITSDRDDTHGGDTNNDGSATIPLASDWSSLLLESGASTIDYAEITYGDRVSIYNTGSSLTVQDTLFDTNVDGVSVYNQAGLTTARNTFTNNTRVPVDIDPDVGTISFGSGGDADTIGTIGGGDNNGYDAIGIGVIDSNTNACPSDICTLSQRTFAGISNIPYFLATNYYIEGSNDTLVIDAGVILKLYWNMSLLVRSGAILDVNGTNGNEVIITSDRDDTHGGDTNNDGSATTPLTSDWSYLSLESGVSTIDYAEIMYGDAISVVNTSTTLTIQDSDIDENTVGIDVRERGGLTTARNTFTNQTNYPVVLNTDVGTVSFGSGGDADTIGTIGGGDANGYDAIGVSVNDNVSSDCPLNTCRFSQRTFAGVSNIPYVLHANYIVSGIDDRLEIDAGVIFKFGMSRTLTISSGALLDVNGTSGNEVIITSVRDDTIGGDTNNDGSATSPAVSDWEKIILSGAGANTFDFLIAVYGERAFEITGTSVAITDSNFEYNTYGIYLNTTVSPVFTRVNLANNSLWGMYKLNSGALVINAENLWWGDATGPLDSDAGGSCSNPTGAGNPVRDIATYIIDYCPWASVQWNAGNTLPVASDVEIDSGASDIDLTVASTKNVVCTATVTDADGYTDIQSVEAKLYRTGVGHGTADDDNNHYTLTGDTECIPSNGAGNSEDYTCTFEVQFHAEPTDAGSIYEADDWTCRVMPSDLAGEGTEDTDTIEMNTLRGLSVTSSIDYGSLAAGDDTGSSNETITVTNEGNVIIDINVSGNNMCTDYPTCSGEILGVGNQEYALIGFTYGGGTSLSVTPTSVDISVAKPTSAPSNSSGDTYWGIFIPGITLPGVYNGENIFEAIVNS